jgi:hypothetical protein
MRRRAPERKTTVAIARKGLVIEMGASKGVSEPQMINDLSDNAYVCATQLLVDLCRQFEEEIGEKPTLEELCNLLMWGLRSCSADTLKDINTCNITALERFPK